MTELNPYTSGYMKPPKEHRFKKGKSGNPKGRPKEPKTIASIMIRILNKKIRIKGEDRKVTMLEALTLRLRELAAKGHPRAIEITRRYEAIRAEQERLQSPPWEEQAVSHLHNLGLMVKDGAVVSIDEENTSERKDDG